MGVYPALRQSSPFAPAPLLPHHHQPTQIALSSILGTLQKQILHTSTPPALAHTILHSIHSLSNNLPDQNNSTIANMGAQDVLSRKTGVIVGDDVLALFKYAQEHKFAIPAIVSPRPSLVHSMHTRCRSRGELLFVVCEANEKISRPDLLSDRERPEFHHAVLP